MSFVIQWESLYSSLHGIFLSIWSVIFRFFAHHHHSSGSFILTTVLYFSYLIDLISAQFQDCSSHCHGQYGSVQAKRIDFSYCIRSDARSLRGWSAFWFWSSSSSHIIFFTKCIRSGREVQIGVDLSISGLPKGVVNMVLGTGAEVGEHLVTNPDVGLVSFTGSQLTIEWTVTYVSIRYFNWQEDRVSSCSTK